MRKRLEKDRLMKLAYFFTHTLRHLYKFVKYDCLNQQGKEFRKKIAYANFTKTY